jgi:hypothetical protein
MQLLELQVIFTAGEAIAPDSVLTSFLVAVALFARQLKPTQLQPSAKSPFANNSEPTIVPPINMKNVESESPDNLLSVLRITFTKCGLHHGTFQSPAFIILRRHCTHSIKAPSATGYGGEIV